MPVEFRRTSKWWYGRFELGGKRRSRRLDVEVKGIPPCREYPNGDPTFLKSKGKAEAALKEHVARTREKRRAEDYVQELHELRTGGRIESIPLGEFCDAWDRAPRRRDGSARYIAQVHSLLNEFVAFVRSESPQVETLAEVSLANARAFMESKRKDKMAARTWNSKLILLRSAFRAVAPEANIVQNPFDGIVTRTEATTHRLPFSKAELQAIVATAERDDFMHPIFVTGMCTAMRLGDCCRLKWADVDLDERFVRVKTSKTGETVEIPMFIMFEELLRSRRGSNEEFVFPEQAAMYATNPQGVSYRARKVFKAAGFYDEAAGKEEARRKIDSINPRSLARKGLDYLAGLPADGMAAAKRARVEKILEMHGEGMSRGAIARELSVAKSTVSENLRDIREAVGAKRVKARAEKRPRHRADIHATKSSGTRKQSVRDFHSFRVTWITLALSAGVPLELVQRVTGHRTTQVVLKHYFKPGRDAFRKAIEEAMPKLLVGEGRVEYSTEGSASEELALALEALKGVTGKTNLAPVEQAAKHIQAAKSWIDGHILREEKD